MDFHFRLSSLPIQIGYSSDGSKFCVLEGSGVLHIYDDLDTYLSEIRSFLIRYSKSDK